MYLVDAMKVVVRRWYVVVAGVLVLIGGAAAVMAYVPTVYQSSGQMVLLLPPGASGTDQPVNPYINLQTGLTTAASLVSGAASTKDVEKEMKAQGMDAEYAVAVIPGTGPLITVSAKDSDAELATATRDAVMMWIDMELQRIQEEVDVPRAQYIGATRSSVSRTAEALPGSKLRALAALGAVVGLLTLLLTFGLDRVLLRRAARRSTRRPVASGREPVAAKLEETEATGTTDGAGLVDGLVLNFHPKRPNPPDTGRNTTRGAGRTPRVGAGR